MRPTYAFIVFLASVASAKPLDTALAPRQGLFDFLQCTLGPGAVGVSACCEPIEEVEGGFSCYPDFGKSSVCGTTLAQQYLIVTDQDFIRARRAVRTAAKWTRTYLMVELRLTVFDCEGGTR